MRDDEYATSRRVCEAKLSFPSRAKAKQYIRTHVPSKKTLAQDPNKVWIRHCYECPLCGAWHLTKKAQR